MPDRYQYDWTQSGIGIPVPPKPEQPRFCDHFVEIGNDPFAGTYCKLLHGHAGDHSPLYADERRGALTGKQGQDDA